MEISRLLAPLGAPPPRAPAVDDEDHTRGIPSPREGDPRFKRAFYVSMLSPAADDEDPTRGIPSPREGDPRFKPAFYPRSVLHAYIEEPALPAIVMKIKCLFCNKMYTSANSVNVHVNREHLGIKHACSSCTKTYAYRSSLLLHQQTTPACGGTRIYKHCSICDKKYANSFESHVMTKNHKKKQLAKDMHATTLESLARVASSLVSAAETENEQAGDTESDTAGELVIDEDYEEP